MERAREGEGKEKKVTTVSGGRGVESGLSQLLLREYGVSTGERGVGGGEWAKEAGRGGFLPAPAPRTTTHLFATGSSFTKDIFPGIFLGFFFFT